MKKFFLIFVLLVVSLSASNLYRLKDVLKYGYIDTSGKWVIQPKFDDASYFSEGLAAVKMNRKWGYIDKQGRWVVKPKFDEVWDFSEGLATVEINGKWGYIDKQGRWVVKPKFDKAWGFSEGLAKVKMNGKWGFIDKQGKWVIKPLFDVANDFSEGLAKVKINGKWGSIDKQGNLIVKPKFDFLEVYKDIIWVYFGDYEGYVSRSGKYLTFNQSELDIVNMQNKKVKNSAKSQASYQATHVKKVDDPYKIGSCVYKRKNSIIVEHNGQRVYRR